MTSAEYLSWLRMRLPKFEWQHDSQNKDVVTLRRHLPGDVQQLRVETAPANAGAGVTVSVKYLAYAF
jgi:hypothetical protein